MDQITSRRDGARKRVTVAAIGAAALVSASVAGIAGPASAALSDCPSSYLCIWKDASFATAGSGTAYVKFQQYIPDYATWDYAGTSYDANNSATSIYNHGVTETAYMYAEDNKDTLLFDIPRGNSNWALGGNQGDNIESGYYHSFN
ncbi:peptidase inhibitor family I36 protein [Microbacterium sp. NEAU-LLC]|uniref:Peptidase inhibitor family I36 protein n=1 Tax=Microbacterium helvum TaxID=2773713 RepID=A0ABR8NM72_9MICO|nr:peptidase inhibitor family I36 protein [Microbacterium helvum]MBD3941761.1 peptidase inhibitor family I36 protein [Microbacterium helvum]